MTERAWHLLGKLKDAGLDEDLAFLCIEQFLSEEELWELPGKEVDEQAIT